MTARTKSPENTPLLSIATLAVCLLAGCYSLPQPGDTVTVAVHGAIGERDLATRRDVAAARPALQAAGIGAGEIAAGRVLRVQCAITTDGWWDSLAVLPADFGPLDGGALLLQVTDRGDNDRLAVNRVVGRAEPPLRAGGSAYRFIPDWRERGLRDNVEEQAPAGGPRDAYLIVQGSWVVRCRR
jgi:outer membrane murein-binding lipoprotein Lpp